MFDKPISAGTAIWLGVGVVCLLFVAWKNLHKLFPGMGQAAADPAPPVVMNLEASSPRPAPEQQSYNQNFYRPPSPEEQRAEMVRKLKAMSDAQREDARNQKILESVQFDFDGPGDVSIRPR